MRTPLPLLSLALIFGFALPVWAACPSRTYTYTTGAVIDPSHVTTNEDNLFSYTCAGVDTYAEGSVNSAAIGDNAVGSSEITADAVGTSEIATSGVGAAEIADGAVDVADMTTTGTAADDKALVADSSTAGTWRTIPNCTDASGNHLNYTQSSNSFSCGTSSSTVLQSTRIAFSRTGVAGSGTVAYTGMGFQPIALMVACINGAGIVYSVGFGDDANQEFRASLRDAGGTGGSNSAQILETRASTGNDFVATLDTLDADGFTLTWTETGTALDTDCGALGMR